MKKQRSSLNSVLKPRRYRTGMRWQI